MKVTEMRKLTDEALGKQLREMEREYFNLRLQLATKKLTNYSRLSLVREKIARAKTILRERGLAAQPINSYQK